MSWKRSIPVKDKINGYKYLLKSNQKEQNKLMKPRQTHTLHFDRARST